MAKTSEEVLEIWGRKFLRDNDWEVGDDETVYVEEGTYDSGYCETCSYVEQVLYVGTESYPSQWRTTGNREIYFGTFSDLLSELIELGQED